MLSRGFASIEEDNAGMQVTIAHQRKPLSAWRDSLCRPPENDWGAALKCARENSLCPD